MSDRPLSGIRVLELSTMIAAPTTAALLADYGATVVKVERPGPGDLARTMGALDANRVSWYWRSLARGKRLIALDLHDPQIQALLRERIGSFDVLIENFRPGTLERFGLAPELLLERNPKLVVLRVTAFGQDGPYRERAGFGTLAEAMTGIAAVTGDQNGPPLLPSYPLADVVTGYLGAAAVNAALLRAGRSGKGEIIDLAIYEAALKLVEHQIMEFDRAGTLHRRLGNRMDDIAPRGAYLCKDGAWVAISGSAQPIAERIMRVVGGEALAGDPRFADNLSRVAHAEELDAAIAAWCAQRTRDEALDQLNAAGAAAGPLETIDSVLNNPQVVARNTFVSLREEGGAALRMTGVFPRFERADAPAPHPGELRVGARTREVLRGEFGLDDASLAALEARGAIESAD
ncbi:MAG TPA: CoA transferase [Candidatus Baltobacteraceae bacterium]|nr:CoA transferase [Candidatus Baltobacteraceae bacterium]